MDFFPAVPVLQVACGQEKAAERVLRAAEMLLGEEALRPVQDIQKVRLRARSRRQRDVGADPRKDPAVVDRSDALGRAAGDLCFQQQVDRERCLTVRPKEHCHVTIFDPFSVPGLDCFGQAGHLLLPVGGGRVEGLADLAALSPLGNEILREPRFVEGDEA